ncbi:MAG: glutaredoxin family protein [Pseudomonadales bacterium]|nr:glutaredoxin family protein [Pseudomonadales bacterium]
MKTLILYTTDGCHLCEFAEQMLFELQKSQSFFLESIDISTDEALVELYGIKIPVVKNKTSEEELGWPFQLEDLLSLF